MPFIAPEEKSNPMPGDQGPRHANRSAESSDGSKNGSDSHKGNKKAPNGSNQSTTASKVPAHEHKQAATATTSAETDKETQNADTVQSEDLRTILKRAQESVKDTFRGNYDLAVDTPVGSMEEALGFVAEVEMMGGKVTKENMGILNSQGREAATTHVAKQVFGVDPGLSVGNAKDILSTASKIELLGGEIKPDTWQDVANRGADAVIKDLVKDTFEVTDVDDFSAEDLLNGIATGQQVGVKTEDFPAFLQDWKRAEEGGITAEELLKNWVPGAQPGGDGGQGTVPRTDDNESGAGGTVEHGRSEGGNESRDDLRGGFGDHGANQEDASPIETSSENTREETSGRNDSTEENNAERGELPPGGTEENNAERGELPPGDTEENNAEPGESPSGDRSAPESSSPGVPNGQEEGDSHDRFVVFEKDGEGGTTATVYVVNEDGSVDEAGSERFSPTEDGVLEGEDSGHRLDNTPEDGSVYVVESDDEGDMVLVEQEADSQADADGDNEDNATDNNSGEDSQDGSDNSDQEDESTESGSDSSEEGSDSGRSDGEGDQNTSDTGNHDVPNPQNDQYRPSESEIAATLEELKQTHGGRSSLERPAEDGQSGRVGSGAVPSKEQARQLIKDGIQNEILTSGEEPPPEQNADSPEDGRGTLERPADDTGETMPTSDAWRFDRDNNEDPHGGGDNYGRGGAGP